MGDDIETTDASPVPQGKVQVLLPMCRCGKELEHIKYMDYSDIRVVFHDPEGCVIGVINK